MKPRYTSDAAGRRRYVCAAGHRVTTLWPCPFCRGKIDAGVRRYFRRISDRMLKEAA